MNALAALLMCLTVMNPSTELTHMRRSGDVQPKRIAELLETADAGNQDGSRAVVCQSLFLTGELYRQADALVPGQGYAERALELFRSMRVDYMDMSAGLLGYVGEARVHLQQGDPRESLASLSPILDSRTDPAIHRLAQLQAMEAELQIDPRLALKRAGEVGEAANWVRARAYAAMGDRESALKYARTDEAKTATPAFDRLKLIAELKALTPTERLAWAQQLASVGRDDEALTLLDDAGDNSEANRLRATLLQQAGRYDKARTFWQRVVDDDQADADALMAYGKCLTSLAEQSDETTAAGYRKQAAALYERAVTMPDVEEDVRRDAMRRWFAVSGPDAPRTFIADQEALILTDPYLRYARLRVLGDDLERTQWLTELTAITEQTDDPQLKALATMALTETEPDPRAALAELNDAWALLSTQPITSQQAYDRRAALWIELGMIDQAVKAIEADPSAGSARSYLTVASALADRYVDGLQGDAQAKVVELTGSAMTQAPTDEAVALKAAILLVRVEAYSDALRILESLDGPEADLTMASALRKLGRTGEALKRLEGNTTVDASLQRSLCEYDLQRFDRALEAARQVRSDSPAGSDTWWRGTLALARSYIALEKPNAAQDVLRVSEALHPVGDRAWLIEALKQIKKELNG